MSGAVLVTGGAGYVGSHACKALAAAGYTPVCFDNMSHGHAWAVRWGPLEQGDLVDRMRLDQLMARYNPVAVMHFAAFAYVGESVEDPAKYYQNNVAGTLCLLESMLAHNVASIVFSSTCATYGLPDRTPISEEQLQRPVNPYGASKLMVERILQDFGQAYGLRHVALRYFNAAGADPDQEIGEVHHPERHLIPLALLTAAGASASITIHGNDYPTPDGTCIRDYVHVSDLANAHVLAMRDLVDRRRSLQLNLGTGQGHSVREVLASVRRVTQCDFSVEEGPRRPGDPPLLVASAGLAESVLGWKARHTELDTLISHSWAWMQRAFSVGYLRRA